MAIPEGFRQALSDLAGWWRAAGARGYVIGGIAASVYGRPRVTNDIDATVLLDEDQWDEFLIAGREFGFLPRVSDPIEFARRSRMLLAIHDPTGIPIDLALGLLPFEIEAAARARKVEIAGTQVPLISPEDLLVMKAVAGRPRDLADIEGVLDACPGLDLTAVRSRVAEFAGLLEDPEMLPRFDGAVGQKRFN